MGYEEAEAHLAALGIDAMKSMAPSLHRMRALCEALNHPERSIPAIHITGTNGKSSTARISASLMTATGLTVGTYTSPHLETMRERLSIGGEPVSKDLFGEVFDHLHPYIILVERQLGERLTYFEIMTAMFFLWASESVDAVVVEVGLGGRWDATNVVEAPVSIVTNIGLDHVALLGPDKAAIAREKVGIVKPASTVVTAELDPAILGILNEETEQLDVTFSRIGRDFEVLENRVAFGGRYLSIRTSSRLYEGLFLPLHGSHQGVNAATALEAVVRFFPADTLSEEVVAEGFEATRAPGRLETVRPRSDESAAVVVDVAHNPEGMAAVISSLLEEFAFDKVIFVVGILQDKDPAGILAELTRVPSHVITTQAKNARAFSAAELADRATALGLSAKPVEDVSDAVVTSLQVATHADLVCVTGSHYVVGEARAFLGAGVD
ncbi:MAG: bifunctional folylpolyglutamate synthase/dihydrofolate synthase, partial [Actinobacteria bacterium]|nr:bifunctional folylpolyglutamate synthase/dihydrofolate synthase [Actinomycetota bacterium]